MARTVGIHASCVLVGESGVLIRGAAGVGKSTLAVALIEAAASRGVFARLVGDDRMMLSPSGGRLIARPHPAIAGLVERRGLGLTPLPAAAGAVIRLVVDLTPEASPRLPEPEAMVVSVSGLSLPRLTLGPGAERPSHVLAALKLFDLP